ncbi:MAG: extracellular solute-binding protein [Acidimicrobiales bacterium]
MITPRSRALAILVLASVAITACSALEPQTLAFAEDDLDPAVIRVATADPTGLAEPLGEWDRNHPTVSLELQVLDEDELRALALFDPMAIDPDEDANAEHPETPDVVVFDASWAPVVRAHARMFLDLNLFGAEAWRSHSIEWRWDAGSVETAQVGLPLDAGGLALAWRADLVGSDLNASLSALDSWCALIDAGDRYADDSGNAFLPEVSSLFTTVVEQSNLGFRDGEARSHESDPSVRHAWDLAMRALGEDALFEDPCPELDDVQRIASTIVPGSTEWATAIVDGLVAAQLVSSHDLLDLEAESPVSARWRATMAPGVIAPERGRTLAIRADTEAPALAWDLVATLVAPSTQRRLHDMTGRIPAASSLLEPGALADSSVVDVAGTEFTTALVASVNGRSTIVDDIESALILREMSAAIELVAAGSQTPRDAWDEAVWRIGQRLP